MNKLINCATCLKQVAVSASACPKCGADFFGMRLPIEMEAKILGKSDYFYRSSHYDRDSGTYSKSYHSLQKCTLVRNLPRCPKCDRLTVQEDNRSCCDACDLKFLLYADGLERNIHDLMFPKCCICSKQFQNDDFAFMTGYPEFYCERCLNSKTLRGSQHPLYVRRKGLLSIFPLYKKA